MNRMLAMGILFFSGMSMALPSERLQIRHITHSLDFATSEEWVVKTRYNETAIAPLTEAVADQFKAMAEGRTYDCEAKVWKQASPWGVFEMTCK